MKSVITGLVLFSAQLANAACLDAEASNWMKRMMDARVTGGDFPSPFSGAVCQTSAVSGKETSSVCYWEYKYRNQDASETLDRFINALQSCFAVDQVPDDQPVNHPDSYDLYQYVIDETRVSLALKDKAALNKTYVFLRFEPGSDG